jgi:FixJ family two-component response regulator
MNALRRRPVIAVIDDDVSVCRAIKRLVWTHGIKAETFTSGIDFIAMLEALPSLKLDCVVLDMQMPGLDGLELQTRLAAMRPRLPVVFLTASITATARKRALAGGAVAFFRKPLDREIDNFVKTLRAVLEMERPDA